MGAGGPSASGEGVIDGVGVEGMTKAPTCPLAAQTPVQAMLKTAIANKILTTIVKTLCGRG